MHSDSPKKNPEEKNVGVYICHCGGNISDHVDVTQLAKNIETIDGVSVTHTNMFMCSDPGQELIQEDIKNGKIKQIDPANRTPIFIPNSLVGYWSMKPDEAVKWYNEEFQANAKMPNF